MKRCKDCKWHGLEGYTLYNNEKFDCFAGTTLEKRTADNCRMYTRKWWKFWRPK